MQRIRDIRSSERNFYQQVTDVYATATDYDPRADITREFFATVQNKMHGGTSDARNGKIFNIFSLVRIGERSGMGLSSLYGVWEKEKFAAPSIVESYEPDRTKVMVEFEADESELGVKNPEVGVENPEVGVETSELGVNPDFEVLMGAYRNDFRANARKVLSTLAEHPEMDFVRLSQVLNLSQNSVWRAVRALREVGLLVREGADKGGKWIVKK